MFSDGFLKDILLSVLFDDISSVWDLFVFSELSFFSPKVFDLLHIRSFSQLSSVHCFFMYKSDGLNSSLGELNMVMDLLTDGFQHKINFFTRKTQISNLQVIFPTRDYFLETLQILP